MRFIAAIQSFFFHRISLNQNNGNTGSPRYTRNEGNIALVQKCNCSRMQNASCRRNEFRISKSLFNIITRKELI